MSKYIFLLIFSISAAFGSDFSNASADVFLGLYTNYISSVKHHASQCQFIPSCSAYGAECVHEHGAALGSIMAADRWMRCAGGTANKYKYPKLGKYFYDPPHKNYLFDEGGLWSAGMNINSGGIRLAKDEPISFVHSLFREDDYSSAILELKRMKYNSKDTDTSHYIDMMISVCNFRLGKIQTSLNCYESDYNFSSDLFKKNQFYYNFLLHDQIEADLWNLNYLRNHKSELISEETQSNLLLYTMLKLEKVKPDDTFKYVNSDSIKVFCEMLEDTPKSPVVAGIMSAILPGAGYFYCGEFKEGTSALVVNGLLAWGIYSLFDNNNTGSGILMSSVSAIFYLGNIAGSVNSAQVINDRYTQMQYLGIRQSLKIDFIFETSVLEEMMKLVK